MFFTMILKTTILLALFSTLNAGLVNFKYCGGVANITKLDIKPCVNPGLCLMKKGTNIELNGEFRIKVNVQSASGHMSGIVAGEQIPFSLDTPNIKSMCNNKPKLSCSLSSSALNTFSTNVPIQKMWPTLTVPIQWTMVDEKTQKVLLCAKFKAKIVD